MTTHYYSYFKFEDNLNNIEPKKLQQKNNP
jgi:hypothetical protein